MRTLQSVTLLGALLATGLAHSQAESFPARPVRLIVPFAPGGGTDILARVLAHKLTETWRQQVVVDNRPGAGGAAGAEITAKAAGDGYTLLMVSASYSVNATLYKLPYDPLKDIAAVAQVASVPFAVVGHPGFAANSVQELIALARAKPGGLNYASSGNGSSPHLAGELFNMMTGVQIIHVPYRGGSPALADVMGGRVHLSYGTITLVLPFVKAGRLKALAVSSPRRSAALPDTPTIAEAGVPGYDVTNWFGVLAPGTLSAALVARVNRDVNAALGTAEMKDRLAAEGADPVAGTAQAFAALVRADIEKYGKIVKAAGIKLQ